MPIKAIKRKRAPNTGPRCEYMCTYRLMDGSKHQRPCTRPAGSGTLHPGAGHCWQHKGNERPGSVYSKIKPVRVLEIYREMQKVTDPTNLLPEIALLRAVVIDQMERFQEIQEAVLAWHESFTTGKHVPKPRQMPDFASIASTIDKVGSMVERVQKKAGALTLDKVNELLTRLGEDVVLSVKEVGVEEPLRTRLLEAIVRRWEYYEPWGGSDQWNTPRPEVSSPVH